jgi:hypothetical protein
MLPNKVTYIFREVLSFANDMVNISREDRFMLPWTKRALNSDLPDFGLPSLDLGHLLEILFPISSSIASFRSSMFQFTLCSRLQTLAYLARARLASRTTHQLRAI